MHSTAKKKHDANVFMPAESLNMQLFAIIYTTLIELGLQLFQLL